MPRGPWLRQWPSRCGPQLSGSTFTHLPAGHTLDENPEVLRIFKGFVERRGWNKTEIIHPAQAGNGNVYLFLLTF